MFTLSAAMKGALQAKRRRRGSPRCPVFDENSRVWHILNHVDGGRESRIGISGGDFPNCWRIVENSLKTVIVLPSQIHVVLATFNTIISNTWGGLAPTTHFFTIGWMLFLQVLLILFGAMLELTPQGRDIPAQGNALGRDHHKRQSPERA